MPELSEIRYSRDTCVSAVREYYRFLTKMYLNESDIIEPPEGGWPTITTTSMQDLGKTDRVISLLRHLPYIREPYADGDQIHGAPWCSFANWQKQSHILSRGHASGEDLRRATEGASMPDDIPPHVVGLTSGGRDNPIFLLDTELGIVNWYECLGEIHHDASREVVQDDPYDYAPENEAEWRAEGAAWAVADFFEILKDQFRELHFVPISSRTVFDVYTTNHTDADGMLARLQDIYREHGWPDLERYRKRECLEAVQKALEERYPNYVD